MTITTRAVTAKTRQTLQLSNIAHYADQGLIGMSRNGVRVFGYNTTNKNQLRYSDNVFTSPSSPTWTTVTTFEDFGTSLVSGLIELFNGEVLVYQTSTVQSVNFTKVWKSSGWSTSPTTATWSLVLTTTGGTCAPQYCIHDFAHGPDGVVLASESGAQTSSGDLATATKAIRVWISYDFGSTWAPFFNLVDWAVSRGSATHAGMHMHGLGYDYFWKRIYLLFGDNTGNGKNVITSNQQQVLYTDDYGATFSIMEAPVDYCVSQSSFGTGNCNQFIAPAFTQSYMVLTPDLNKPKVPLLCRKGANRKFDGFYAIGADSDFVSSRISKRAAAADVLTGVESDQGMFVFPSRATVASGFTGTAYIPVVMSDDLRSFSTVLVQFPLTNSAQTLVGYTDAYVSIGGKIILVSPNTFNNGASKFSVADIIYEI